MFKKILICNRGEIALRIMRACRELGVECVAVHSAADRESLHVKYADESVCVGKAASADSYLKVPNLIAAAEITGAEAIHPGYGFLAENADFAETVIENGFIWIGPAPDTIRKMGDKASRARRRRGGRGAHRAGHPISTVADVEAALEGGRDRSATRSCSRRRPAAAARECASYAAKANWRARSSSRAGKPWPPSATAPSTSSASSSAPGTSRRRSWPTRTATSCTWASATARCSGGTRSSSRKRRRRR